MGWHSLYDELFPRNETAAVDAVCVINMTFDSVHKFAMRQYDAEYNRKDLEHSVTIAEKGNTGLKLAYILLMLAHEKSMRDVIAARVPPTADRERVRKMLLFYRVLAIAARSLFETPFDETNASIFVGLFLQICGVAWICMDSTAMSMYCDHFSARCKEGNTPEMNDFRCDDGGLFDPDEIARPVWSAEDLLRDRCAAACPLAPDTYVELIRSPSTALAQKVTCVRRPVAEDVDQLSVSRKRRRELVDLPYPTKRARLWCDSCDNRKWK